MNNIENLRQFILSEVSPKYIGRKVAGSAVKGSKKKATKVAQKYIKHLSDPEVSVPMAAGAAGAIAGKQVGQNISKSKTAEKIADTKDKKLDQYIKNQREKAAKDLAKNENVVHTTKKALTSKPGRTTTKAIKRAALTTGASGGSVLGYHLTKATDDAQKQKAALDAAIKAKKLEQESKKEKEGKSTTT